MEEIIQQQNIQITVSDYQEKVRHNQIKWLESDLIPKLLAIFEILDKRNSNKKYFKGSFPRL